jgi:hypothetical protein
MIEPVLPPGIVQALAAKAERPLIAIAVLSLPKALAAPAQPRELGGTITQATADGSAVLHTAAGDVAFKASVALIPGKTATLHLVPTSGGLAAALQVNGPTAQLAAVPNTSPGTSGKPAAPAAATPITQPKPPSPIPPASAALRDATLLLGQLAAQASLPLAESAGRPVPTDPAPSRTEAPAAPTAASARAADAAPAASALSATPASLTAGMLAALKRPTSRSEEDARRSDGKDHISAAVPDSTYRASLKPGEQQDQLVWRQLQVMDENRIVPVFLGHRPSEDEPDHAGDETAAVERPARFTIRFDLDHAGPVRIDSVYRERRLEVLLTMEAAPDKEMQAIVRERLAALSDEFGLSISLKIGAPAADAR